MSPSHGTLFYVVARSLSLIRPPITTVSRSRDHDGVLDPAARERDADVLGLPVAAESARR